MKKVIDTKNAPAAVGPYSQAIEANGFLFCSGQIAIDPSTNQVLQAGVPEQTQQVMKNISAVLEAAGLGFDNVIKTTIFLTNMNDFPTVNEIYAKSFKSTLPARSTVAVVGLPKGVQVEIEVIACRG